MTKGGLLRAFDRPLVAAWGTFDVANYGDLMFPRIFDCEIKRRLPSADIRYFSPLGNLHPIEEDSREPPEPLFPFTDSRRKAIAKNLDLLAVGGGEIVHFHDEAYGVYYRTIPSEAKPLEPSRCFIDSLGSELEKTCPVAWNAVGVPDDFDTEQSERVRTALQSKRYISVRDQSSRERLARTGFDGEIAIVPDTVLLMNRVFSDRMLTSHLDHLRRMQWYPRKESPLVLQGNGWVDESSVKDIGKSVNIILEEFPKLPIVLLEIAPCHRDGEFADRLAKHLAKPVFRISAGAHPEYIAAAVRNARLFAGSSLHGHITSAAYGVPSVIINASGQSKLNGFAELLDRQKDVVREAASLAPVLRRALLDRGRHPQSSLSHLVEKIDAHFDRLAEIAESAWKCRVKKCKSLVTALKKADKIEKQMQRSEVFRPPANDRESRSFTPSQARNVVFICNICGTSSSLAIDSLSRESVSCHKCQSTPRFRAVISLLSRELFGERLHLKDFPVRPDIRGIGLSDWIGYATELSNKLAYVNTFYHREPRLDITAAPRESLRNSLDFMIASEVFEHVAPPVESALRHALSLLKPGGTLILTVPYTLEGETVEHFPTLHNWEVLKFRDQNLILNQNRDTGFEIFHPVRLHEGGGATVEMRLFSRDGLLESLDAAGFVGMELFRGDPDAGAIWRDPLSLPLIARRR